MLQPSCWSESFLLSCHNISFLHFLLADPELFSIIPLPWVLETHYYTLFLWNVVAEKEARTG
jgi:hypothetical protein